MNVLKLDRGGDAPAVARTGLTPDAAGAGGASKRLIDR